MHLIQGESGWVLLPLGVLGPGVLLTLCSQGWSDTKQVCCVPHNM